MHTVCVQPAPARNRRETTTLWYQSRCLLVTVLASHVAWHCLLVTVLASHGAWHCLLVTVRASHGARQSRCLLDTVLSGRSLILCRSGACSRPRAGGGGVARPAARARRSPRHRRRTETGSPPSRLRVGRRGWRVHGGREARRAASARGGDPAAHGASESRSGRSGTPGPPLGPRAPAALASGPAGPGRAGPDARRGSGSESPASLGTPRRHHCPTDSERSESMPDSDALGG
jgi:hypothetical protein